MLRPVRKSKGSAGSSSLGRENTVESEKSGGSVEVDAPPASNGSAAIGDGVNGPEKEPSSPSNCSAALGDNISVSEVEAPLALSGAAAVGAETVAEENALQPSVAGEGHGLALAADVDEPAAAHAAVFTRSTSTQSVSKDDEANKAKDTPACADTASASDVRDADSPSNARMTTRKSVLPDVAADDVEAPTFLWQKRSDIDLATDIEKTLKDFDALSNECDEMFLKYAVPGSQNEESQFIPAQRLHQVTQQLIDRLGCRSASVLERIGLIYNAAAAGSSEAGLGQVEFRGYVASVLTQILRELEARQARKAGGGAGQSSPGSARAETAGDAALGEAGEGADTSGSLLETIRGLFNNVAWPFPAWEASEANADDQEHDGRGAAPDTSAKLRTSVEQAAEPQPDAARTLDDHA